MLETDPEKVFGWLALKSIPRIGNVLFKKLIDRFSTPENVFAASAKQLRSVEGISESLAAAIGSHRVGAAVKREIDRALEKGFRIVTYADEQYPCLLRQIYDPPPYLYVSGELDGQSPNIGVVGSRNPTRYGLSNAGRLSKGLVSLGFAVVSGMARGIDSAAHIGALSGNGKTVAVLGSGLERIYPPENQTLFARISENGAVVSEFPLRAAPEPHHFPARNRIISGMSLGVVVVEAAKKSGSLITARLAAEQNREVFAVPGSIASFKSAGTHNLIRQGAKLVEHVRDIVEELAPQMAGRLEPEKDDGYYHPDPNQSADLNPDERKLLACMEPYPIHIDELIAKTSLAPGAIAGILMKLELDGHVEQLPGKRFCLKNRGRS